LVFEVASFLGKISPVAFPHISTEIVYHTEFNVRKIQEGAEHVEHQTTDLTIRLHIEKFVAEKKRFLAQVQLMVLKFVYDLIFKYYLKFLEE
jgi:hypothetical protein